MEGLIAFIIVTATFLVVGYCKAQADRLMQLQGGDSPMETWKNKWKLDDKGELVPPPENDYFKIFGVKFLSLLNVYYKLFRLKYTENYLFSATLLVGFTDPWHKWNSYGGLALYIGFTLLLMMIDIKLVFALPFLFISKGVGFHSVNRYK